MNWFFVCLTICSIIYLFYKIQAWMHDFCCDPLSYVVVTGNRYFTSNDDIRNAIMQLEALGTFFTQDINIIQKKIEQLPWINKVSIRKRWPDTLQINIVEYIPIAYWNDNLVISTTGTIIRIPNLKEIYKNKNIWIPVLYGPDNKAQDVLSNYLIFREILQSNTFHIKSAKMDIRGAWQLALTEGICLKLGKDNVIERLRYFIKIYPILFQKIHEKNQCVDYIDLRYRSGFAVKWIYNVMTSIALCNE